MRIGKRLFPYPIINNNNSLSEYKEGVVYELKVDFDSNGGLIKTRDHIFLKNAHFVLNDSDLINLFLEEKVKATLIVESSSAVFREKYDLTMNPTDIKIPLCNLKDDVYVSSYIYANENILNFSSVGFDEVYDGYIFDLEKYDIIAADDGFRFSVDYDPMDDNKASSIFTVIKDEMHNDNVLRYKIDQKKIYIQLPTEQYVQYSTTKNYAKSKNIFFAMLVIPVLSMCLNEVQQSFTDGDEISDIINQYRWFTSICFSYKKETGKDITMDVFKSTPSLELAQLVFNYSSLIGMSDFCDMMDQINGKGDADDEQD